MGTDNRRRSGRLVCAGLVSELGDVTDLSAGGCRIVCKRVRPLAIGARYSFTLRGPELEVMIHGRIVRRTRQKLFEYEYGVEFIDVNDQQRACIAELSRTGVVKRLMPTVDEAAARAAA